MRATGMRRSPARSGAEARRRRALGALAAIVAGPVLAEGMTEPLTDTPGDPARGRAIVADRTVGLCIMCHAAPLPEVPFMGDLAPDLAGVADRLSVAELRERIVDSRRTSPDTIMPPYYSTDGFVRVGARWRGTTILDAQQVEDVVAYLATLTDRTAHDGAER